MFWHQKQLAKPILAIDTYYTTCSYLVPIGMYTRVETGSVPLRDPDDPLTRIEIWVRPGFDPDMTRLNKETQALAGARKHRFKWSNIFFIPKDLSPPLTSFCKICTLYTHSNTWLRALFDNSQIKHDSKLLPCSSYFLSYPSSSLKYSHHQWPDLKHLEQNWEMYFHRHQGQVIINACDIKYNLGQTQISYKVGQAHLTWTKCDPDDLTWFQP